MSIIIVYVTHKNQVDAQKITQHLLGKRLIACANFMPIKSAYWWQGTIESEDEVVSPLKTRKENWDILKEEVEKIHSYETPCIMKFEVEANESYEDWIKKETDANT